MDIDERYMRRALELAARGRGTASPNPMVGAVVVRDGETIGEGWHRRPGEPHAEVNALAAAGGPARGADLYVTLEPCAHHGRTPPCVEAIVAAGIRRVVVAVVDPNPRVSGEGIDGLRAAGVVVETGLLVREARRLNEAYLKWIVTGLPFVTMKMAVSLDGRIATRTRHSRWISGEESRRRAHQLRGEVDAVLAGVGTVLADDPLLNVRLDGWEGRQPMRVVVDSRLRMPAGARMLREGSGGPVVVATCPDAPADHRRALEKAGAEVLTVEGKEGRVDLRSLLAELGARGIASVLLEGGAGLFTSALEEGVADKVAVFVAPVIIGGAEAPPAVGGRGAETMADALRLREVSIAVLGEDVLVEGYVRRGEGAGGCSPD